MESKCLSLVNKSFVIGLMKWPPFHKSFVTYANAIFTPLYSLTSTDWASTPSLGGWTCNSADRHCCIITLTDGELFIPLDAICALDLIISFLATKFTKNVFLKKMYHYLYRSTYDPDGKKVIRELKKCIMRWKKERVRRWSWVIERMELSWMTIEELGASWSSKQPWEVSTSSRNAYNVPSFKA